VHPHKPPGSKHLAPLLVSTSTLVHQGCTGASEPSFPAPSSLTSQIQDNTSHPITPVQTLRPWHKRLAPRASQLRRQQPHQTTQVKHSNQADHHTKAPIFRADHASYLASRRKKRDSGEPTYKRGVPRERRLPRRRRDRGPPPAAASRKLLFHHRPNRLGLGFGYGPGSCLPVVASVLCSVNSSSSSRKSRRGHEKARGKRGAPQGRFGNFVGD
jgi:hypothetical protein